MAEGVGEPRIEDFGITEDDLGSAPCLFLASHRAGVLVGAYLVVGVGVFAVILSAGHSLPAAALFTIITVAAASVLLLPFLTLVLCASEQAEERWLCRRFPKLSACLAYRRAVAEHARVARSRRTAAARPRKWWATASTAAFREAVMMELARLGSAPSVALSRDGSGVDLALKAADGEVLIRCEAGSDPVPAAVGREIAAALTDRDARRAVVVTTARPAPALVDYIADRPIDVVAPWQLDTINWVQASGTRN